MAKPRTALTEVRDYLVYILVRLIVCVIQALSFSAACRLAGVLAWLLYKADRRHRLVADDNLRHAFGDQFDQAERDELVRAVYRHFCLLLIEIVHVPRMLAPRNWKSRLRLPPGTLFALELLLSGRPLLVVSGHFGNWELGGYSLALLGFRTFAIARRLDNPWLHDFLLSFRERTGQKVLDKDGDWEAIQAALEGHGILMSLGDQDAGRRGRFVDFFGRPASTHRAIALLSLQFQAPLIVMMNPRVPVFGGLARPGRGGDPLYYEMVAADYILPEEYDGRRDAVEAMTQRFTAALEGVIRRYPEQYFWLHRRWKHQPEPKKARRAA
jgi:KDO2-lipid IV(A) lauroyltransferase